MEIADRLRLSLKNRGLIVAIIAVVIAIIVGASYAVVRMVEVRAHAAAEKLVNQVVEHIDSRVADIEKVTRDAAKIAASELNDPDALEQLTRDHVEHNGLVYGSTVAFEPNAFPNRGRCFAPFSWITPDEVVHTRQLGTETDYYEEEWYAQTKLLGKEYWCEPYYDEGGAKIMMCTFSVPLKDRNGRLKAVMTSDVGLAELEDYISSITPDEESYIVLRSKKGNTLVNIERDLRSGDHEIIIKGTSGIGWTVELTMPFINLMRGDMGMFAFLGIAFMLVVVFVLFVNRLLHRMQESANKEFHNVIGALAADYSSVYYVDLDSEKVTPYSMDEETEKKMGEIFQKSKSYPDAFRAYVDKFVYEPDKEMMLTEGKRKNVLEHLMENDSFLIIYRGLVKGVITFCEMRFVVTHKEKEKIKGVTLGFAYKDQKIMADYINEKLVAEYISAFLVDLDTDTYRIFRHPDTTSVMDREDRVWSKAMEDFAHECEEEYFELVKNIGSPRFLKEELAEVDRREYLYRFPSSSQPWRRSVIQVIDRKDGIPSTVVATFTAIDDYQSKIKDQEKQLAAQQEELKAANKSKTDFLFNMSHDIRTPMNAIIGFTQVAKKNIDDQERVKDSLEKIESSGSHLLDLINEVLDMSRVEAGKMHCELKTVNLVDSAMKLMSICQEAARQKNIDLRFNAKNILHHFVVADELHINQVIMNILGNALKYTEPGGRVTYTAEELESDKPGYGKYLLTVEDTGVGMSPEFLKRVFEAFSRDDNARISKVQGTGLGMSIVKRLVEYLDGTVDVESELGKGTKVTVAFHLLFSNGKSIQEVKAEEAEVDFTGKKILLVEDNELNREIATMILEERGIEVETAENGLEAVERIKTNGTERYNLILMDIQMPLMNGYEATKAIRKLEKEDLGGASHIPIIALSANAFEEDKKMSVEAGMDDHIAKPIDVDELFGTLSKYVR